MAAFLTILRLRNAHLVSNDYNSDHNLITTGVAGGSSPTA